MLSFGQLRKEVLKKSGAKDMFEFRRMSPAHNAFWDAMNGVEFDRGYVTGEYERPGSPALCDMRLLTEAEYQEWLARFEKFKNQRA